MASPSLFEKVMIKIASLYFGVPIFFKLVVDTFKYGFSAVWRYESVPRPAVLDDPSLGTHGFLHLEDVRIHYVASGPEDKPLMLFLHGFPEFWYSWRHQIKEFQKDYRVVAIDQRGYGESDKPAGIGSYVVSKLISDIKQVILALGYKKCILVSHDWGGAVGWAFGRFFPDMVDKLIVLNAPAQPAMQKLLPNHSAQQKMSWYFFFFQLPYLPEILIRARNFFALEQAFGEVSKPDSGFWHSKHRNPMSEEDLIAYKHVFSQPGALTPPINWYRAAFQKPSVRYDMDFVIPVLLIWGMNDHCLHSDLVTQIEKDFPKCATRRIEDANHFVQMDAPDVVNETIREWLGAGEK